MKSKSKNHEILISTHIMQEIRGGVGYECVSLMKSSETGWLPLASTCFLQDIILAENLSYKRVKMESRIL